VIATPAVPAIIVAVPMSSSLRPSFALSPEPAAMNPATVPNDCGSVVRPALSGE